MTKSQRDLAGYSLRLASLWLVSCGSKALGHLDFGHCLVIGIWSLVIFPLPNAVAENLPRDGAFHVHPGEEIQLAIELAAKDSVARRVIVHAGTYYPKAPGQALIWLNQAHDGIRVEAEGEVTLTARNEELADREAASFPAIVNHVVYFGDGISRKTVFRGFKITGANNFVTDRGGGEAIEPNFAQLRRTEGSYGKLFFFTDGGAIKVFGRSYPVIEGVELVNNFASPCAGGISIEHRGFKDNSVLLTNCVFRGNRASVTGSAVDLLPGSAVEIRNCLFVGNVSNTGQEYIPVKGNIDWPEIPRLLASTFGYQARHGSGALTVFPNSVATVDRCTFTDNFNGVDDKGGRSTYSNSIFWQNRRTGGKRSGGRFELDVARGTLVTNCLIGGEINDLMGMVDGARNLLNGPDPQFDEAFTPRNPKAAKIGYRKHAETQPE